MFDNLIHRVTVEVTRSCKEGIINVFPSEVDDNWAGISLSALLAESGLDLRLVVETEAPSTLLITDAHSTEMVDPRPYVRPGELICTVGSSLVTPVNCGHFVYSVKQAGATAICLGLGEVHLQAPINLIDECRKQGLPLLELSTGVPFLAINELLISHRFHTLTTTTERDKTLLQRLLVHLHHGDPFEQLISTAESALGGEIRYGSFHASQSDEGQRTSQAVSLEAGEQIVWIPPTGTVSDKTDVLQQIGRALQISRMNALEQQQQTSRQIGHLFSLIIDGLAHPGVIATKLEELRLADASAIVSAWPPGTFHSLSGAVENSLIADTDEMIFMVSPVSCEIIDIAHALGLVCGYSSPVVASDIQRGILEARATLKLARKRGEICGPTSLADFTTLLEQQPQGILDPFIHQFVHPLLSEGIRGGEELLDTLRAFIAHDGSFKATAQAQYLHINTVRHRLGRIRELVDKDPSSPIDLTDLRVAVWAYDHLKVRRN